MIYFQKRVEVFIEMLESEEIDKVSVDVDQTDQLLRLLDAVVIKLEGGTEEDLKVLDAKPQPQIIPKERTPAPSEKTNSRDELAKALNELKDMRERQVHYFYLIYFVT